jgi:branched-chain amino acid transport system permease protein
VLASALGINIKRTKVVAYALAAIPAGVAGVLFDFLDGYVSPPTFGLTTTLTVIAASVIGGSRSLLGPFVATAVLMGLPIWSASLSSYSMLISGALLVIAGLMSVFNLRTSAVFGVLPSWLTRRGRGETSLLDETEVGPGEGSEKVIELDDHRGSELVVDGLTVHFGGVTAVDGVSLCAKPGQITALIGPNGSGKTSLLNLISGFYRPTAGQVHVSATDVSGMSVAGRSRRGISRTFQTPLMPPYSTVADVVSSGRYTKRYVGYLRAVLRTPGYRRALHEDEAAARQCLRMLGIEHTYPLVASSLPLGTRRLVELARVVVSRPEVILLDEPASGLSPDEVGVMSTVLSAIRERGATIVLVEHNFRMIQSLADTVYVLDQGGMLAQGSIEEIQANEDVARIYLGTELTPAAEHGQMGQADA